MSRRQKTIGAVVLVVALVAASGIAYAVSSGGSTSGHQVVVLSTVQRRTLQGTVALTGTLARKQIRNVTAATQALVSDVSAKAEAFTSAGQVMFALNGRNGIAENGDLPFFRTLVPGDSGSDVLELKQILDAAGDYAGPSSDLYTEQTQFALAQWQAQHGYPNSTPATPQSVSVSLEQGTGYELGDQDTAGLIIGPPATQTASLTAEKGGATTGTTDHRAVLAGFLLPHDPTPTLSIQSVADQVTAGQPANFIVSASAASTSDLTVNLTPGGTAGPDNVVTPPATATITAGALETEVTVQTRATSTVQPTTTISMAIAGGTGYSVGSPSSAQTTIQNGVVPTLQITGGATVPAGGSATLTITANQAPLQNMQVALSFGGNATAGTAYMVPDPVVTLAAGSTSTTVTLTTLTNNLIQPNTYVVVSLSPDPSEYTVGSPGSAVVTIGGTTNVPKVTLTSATTYLQKGQPYVVSVGLNQAQSTPLTINLSYGGTATPGVDYTVPAGTLVVPAGQTSLTVQIPTVTDNLVESDRVLTVSLASGAYTVGSPSSASVSITSQVVPKLTIAANTSALAQGGAATFVITASAAPTMNTSVSFSVQGTAQPGQNYEPLTGAALLAAGQTQVTVTLQSLQRNITFDPTDMIVGSWPTRVGTVYVKAGQPVAPGTNILSLTEPDLTVTLDASASNRTQLVVGQSCTVQIDGENNTISGTVTELDSTPTSVAASSGQGSQQLYEGKIEAPGLDGADGSAVSITVVTEQKSNDADRAHCRGEAERNRPRRGPRPRSRTVGTSSRCRSPRASRKGPTSRSRGLRAGQTVVVEVDQNS